MVVGYALVLLISLISNQLVDGLLGQIDTVPSSIRFALSIVPPFALYRGLLYLAAEVAFQGPGFSMSNLGTDVVNMNSCYAFLAVEWVIIMVCSILQCSKFLTLIGSLVVFRTSNSKWMGCKEASTVFYSLLQNSQ